MTKKACIIANSPDIQSELVAKVACESDLVIIADGGANRIPDSIKPHVICGDFDSVDLALSKQRFPSAECIQLESQETNDLEKCITLALEKKAGKIAIVQALGGRLDHSLVTLSLLERYHNEAEITLHDGEMVGRVISSLGGEYLISVSVGGTISIVPRGDGATVTISSVQWPLSKERMIPGSRGVSNKALADQIPITVHEGVVYCVYDSAVKRSS